MSWACLSTILNSPHMTPQQAFTVKKLLQCKPCLLEQHILDTNAGKQLS